MEMARFFWKAVGAVQLTGGETGPIRGVHAPLHAGGRFQPRHRPVEGSDPRRLQHDDAMMLLGAAAFGFV